MKAIIDSETIRQLSLFEGLKEEDLHFLLDESRELTASKNTYLYELDMPSDHMFILGKGSLKIGTFSADGREVLKAISHPVSLVGELGLAGETHRREFARVQHEDARVIAIPVARVKALMQRDPDFSMKVLDHIGNRLLQTERRMESIIFQDARSRIIQFLKDTASKRGRRVGFEWLLKHSLTQQDIANITGTSRQTVTSVLNELRKENLIHFNRRSILIRDLTRLA